MVHYQLIVHSLGGGNIQISICSDKKDVLKFLTELRQVLSDDNFVLNQDIIIIKKEKPEGKKQFSTPYTLVDLEYDTEDIAECLKNLAVEEYSETKIDKDDDNPPLLFVFGKLINGKQIYIKLKIKVKAKKHILCLSFHYAERTMRFPYA